MWTCLRIRVYFTESCALSGENSVIYIQYLMFLFAWQSPKYTTKQTETVTGFIKVAGLSQTLQAFDNLNGSNTPLYASQSTWFLQIISHCIILSARRQALLTFWVTFAWATVGLLCSSLFWTDLRPAWISDSFAPSLWTGPLFSTASPTWWMNHVQRSTITAGNKFSFSSPALYTSWIR